jgi:hypothetical protein
VVEGIFTELGTKVALLFFTNVGTSVVYVSVPSNLFITYKVGQNHVYIYGVYTVILAGKSPDIRP